LRQNFEKHCDKREREKDYNQTNGEEKNKRLPIHAAFFLCSKQGSSGALHGIDWREVVRLENGLPFHG
jgi:hypothetical protein